MGERGETVATVVVWTALVEMEGMEADPEGTVGIRVLLGTAGVEGDY